MRLYPPAWLIGRRALSEVRIGRYRIPAGAVVLTSPFVTHRNPRYYVEPETFLPERWPLGAIPKFAFFPFDGGARVCIGEQFAWNEGVLLLATIAQRYRCEPGREAVGFAPFVTLRPDRPVRMRLRVREAAVRARSAAGRGAQSLERGAQGAALVLVELPERRDDAGGLELAGKFRRDAPSLGRGADHSDAPVRSAGCAQGEPRLFQAVDRPREVAGVARHRSRELAHSRVSHAP